MKFKSDFQLQEYIYNIYPISEYILHLFITPKPVSVLADVHIQ